MLSIHKIDLQLNPNRILLYIIISGAKLKKAVTNDRSSPITGKVGGGGGGGGGAPSGGGGGGGKIVRLDELL